MYKCTYVHTKNECKSKIQHRAASWASFAVPNLVACEALKTCVDDACLQGIVEVGAGTGSLDRISLEMNDMYAYHYV